MPKPTELFTISNALVIALTQLAVKIDVDGEQYWLPFSEIREPDILFIRASRDDSIDMVIPAWLAKDKGLI